MYGTDPKRQRFVCLGNQRRLLGSGPEGQVRFGPMGKRGKKYQFRRIKAKTQSLDLVLPQIEIHRPLTFSQLRTEENQEVKGPTHCYTGGGEVFCSMVRFMLGLRIYS